MRMLVFTLFYCMAVSSLSYSAPRYRPEYVSTDGRLTVNEIIAPSFLVVSGTSTITGSVGIGTSNPLSSLVEIYSATTNGNTKLLDLNTTLDDTTVFLGSTNYTGTNLVIIDSGTSTSGATSRGFTGNKSNINLNGVYDVGPNNVSAIGYTSILTWSPSVGTSPSTLTGFLSAITRTDLNNQGSARSFESTITSPFLSAYSVNSTLENQDTAFTVASLIKGTTTAYTIRSDIQNSISSWVLWATHTNVTNPHGLNIRGTIDNFLHGNTEIADVSSTSTLLLGKDSSVQSATNYQCADCAYLINKDNASLFLGANDSADITILGSGFVGIGSTTPGVLLDVNGPVHITGSLVVDTTATIVMGGITAGDFFPENEATGLSIAGITIGRVTRGFQNGYFYNSVILGGTEGNVTGDTSLSDGSLVLGIAANEDLSKTDISDLTDGGVSTLHTHSLTTAGSRKILTLKLVGIIIPTGGYSSSGLYSTLKVDPRSDSTITHVQVVLQTPSTGTNTIIQIGTGLVANKRNIILTAGAPFVLSDIADLAVASASILYVTCISGPTGVNAPDNIDIILYLEGN